MLLPGKVKMILVKKKKPVFKPIETKRVFRKGNGVIHKRKNAFVVWVDEDSKTAAIKYSGKDSHIPTNYRVQLSELELVLKTDAVTEKFVPRQRMSPRLW